MQHSPSFKKAFSHPRHIIRLGAWVLLYCIVMLLSACEFNQMLKSKERQPMYFAGRLAFSQDADPHHPEIKADSWSAHFEMGGTPTAGDLWLYTPVGTVIAQVNWTPKSATIKTNKDTFYFANIDDLTLSYFQQSIPVPALFDWLQGKPAEHQMDGWQVNLQRAGDGVIRAQRLTPLPQVRLKAIVETIIDNRNASTMPQAAP